MPRPVSLAAILLLAAALAPVTWLAVSFSDLPHAGIFHDDAVYWVTAKSLAESNGHRLDSFPNGLPQTKYPPLYPLLLSVVWRVSPSFPANLAFVMALNGTLLAVFLAAVWIFFRQAGLGQRESLVLTALLALNPVLAGFATMMMPEIVFCALLVAALSLAGRGSAFAAGAVAGLAFLTRTAALPFLIATPALFLLRRETRKAVAAFSGMAPFVAGWMLWSSANRAPANDPLLLFYTDYLGYYRYDVPLSSIPALALDNLPRLVQAAGELLLFDTQPGIGTLTLARLLTAAAIVGAFRLARSGVLVHYALFAVLYSIQFLLWNYPPTSRFLLPLLPLLAVGLSAEMKKLASIIAAAFRKPGIADRAVAGLASLLLAFTAALALYRTHDGLFHTLPETYRRQRQWLAGVRPAFEWLRDTTPPDARVLSYWDPLVYLYSHRRGYSWRIRPGILLRSSGETAAREIARLPEIVRGHRFDYVLLTQLDYHLDRPDVILPAWRGALDNRSLFEPAFRSTGVTVYRVLERPATIAHE